MAIGAAPVPKCCAHARAKAISRISCTPAWNAAGTSPSNICVVSASRNSVSRPAVANVSSVGRGAAKLDAIDPTCRQAPAWRTTSGCRACSANRSDQRWNDVPAGGNKTCCPPRNWVEAMVKSSSRIRQETPSTAR
ncbi:Uncharacterised protein [Mycobacteroides abscessus subsp. abscessus]|nr:Uncharacterised protein [Mycobacteroides abscessus]SHU81758.1 Uncharacterised protein [Mycobacteroides abscessus subsp. abscessus]